jgi:hypothetical protein
MNKSARSDIYIATQALISALVRKCPFYLKDGEDTWGETFAGDFVMHFRPFKDGKEWLIRIFNDCNDFDYIDSIESEDGEKFEYGDLYPDFDLDQPCIEGWLGADFMEWLDSTARSLPRVPHEERTT